MNYDNFNAVLTHIERNPETWSQLIWCGSSCCIAGHAQNMFGDKNHLPWIEGTKALDIDGMVSDWLFAGWRTLDDFRRVRQVYATARLIERAQAA